MATERRNLVEEVRTLVKLLRTRLTSSDLRERDAAGYKLLTRFAGWALPGYVTTKGGKSWFDDAEFFRDYDRLIPSDGRRSAERKHFLKSLLPLADGVPGDTAECGVWTGASSWFICKHFSGTGKLHHGFDSFQGLPPKTSADGEFWREGDTTTTKAVAEATLAGFPVRLYEGWIPERFSEVADRRFSFVHVDLSLYEPTRDSVEFFYPRMEPGGILLFDDYGSSMQSPGTARAIDEFMQDKPEPVIEVPTAQAFVIKR